MKKIGSNKFNCLFISSFLLIAIVLSMFLIGCSHEDIVVPSKKRTILAYLAADNNLSGELEAKKADLLAGWQPELGELLLFVDGSAGCPVLLRAVKRKGQTTVDTICRYRNNNSASPALLRQVIADMKAMAPSISYGFILFSHGNGWLPRRLPITRAVIVDKGRMMSLDNFANALPDGCFEFILSDMCFMGSVEVAYALREKVAYLVGAPTKMLSPGFTGTYRQYLYFLYEPKPKLISFAKEFFDSFRAAEGMYHSATISVVSTQYLSKFAQYTHDLIKDNPMLADSEILACQYFDKTNRRKYVHLYYDLKDYLYAYASDDDKIRQSIDEILGRVVLYAQHTDKFFDLKIKHCCGLSVYIPQKKLYKLNDLHRKTAWGKAIF